LRSIIHEIRRNSAKIGHLINTKRNITMNLNAQTRLVALQTKLTQHFGSYAESAKWMQTPNPEINNLPPLSLLKSDEGLHKIEELLKLQ